MSTHIVAPINTEAKFEVTTLQMLEQHNNQVDKDDRAVPMGNTTQTMTVDHTTLR